MPHLERDVVIVAGHSGFGKTVWSKTRALESDRVLVVEGFSDENEYHTERIESFRALLEFFQSHPKTFRVSFYPMPCYRSCCQGKRSEFVHVCELVYAVGGMLYVVEECASYFPKRVVPQEFMQLATKGRHREVSMILTAQAPSYIPIEARRESDRLVVFNLSEKADLDWVAGYPGSDGNVSEDAKQLKRLQFLEIHKTPAKIERGRIEL